MLDKPDISSGDGAYTYYVNSMLPTIISCFNDEFDKNLRKN